MRKAANILVGLVMFFAQEVQAQDFNEAQPVVDLYGTGTFTCDPYIPLSERREPIPDSGATVPLKLHIDKFGTVAACEPASDRLRGVAALVCSHLAKSGLFLPNKPSGMNVGPGMLLVYVGFDPDGAFEPEFPITFNATSTEGTLQVMLSGLVGRRGAYACDAKGDFARRDQSAICTAYMSDFVRNYHRCKGPGMFRAFPLNARACWIRVHEKPVDKQVSISISPKRLGSMIDY
jgi:hypothetical protein